MIYCLRNIGLTALLILNLGACELLDSKHAGIFSSHEKSATDIDGNNSESELQSDGRLTGQSAPLEPLPIVINASSDQDEVLQIMRYARVMNAYPKSRLKPEFKRLAGELVNDQSDANKIQLAILLSIPDTTFINEKRATELLNSVVNDVSQSSSALQEYAYLLLELMLSRRETKKLQDQLTQELQDERQKRVQLQEQLNALKSIEKSISRRQLNTEAENQ